MVAAGANRFVVVAVVVCGGGVGLEVGMINGCPDEESGGGTGADADLDRTGWLGGKSEDSFESETLRRDLISTLGGVFVLFLPKSGRYSSTRGSDVVEVVETCR